MSVHHTSTRVRRTLAACLTGAALLAFAGPAALADTPGAPGGPGAPGAPGAGDHPGDDGGGAMVLRGPSAGVRTVTLGARLVAPTPTRALPSALDVRPTYQPGVSCDPIDRPGSVRLGRLLVDTYGTGYFGVSRYCNGTLSEHHEGRAVDWMLNSSDPMQKAVADSFLAWLTANSGEQARRLGIQYVIWNRTMWRAYAPERGFTPYSGASPHTDHIHLSLTWDGALGRTSWWTGTPVTTADVGTCRVYAGQPAPLYTSRRTTPCPSWVPAPPASPLPVIAIGSGDKANVARGQKALGLVPDGVFGRGTQSAVLAYQRARGLPASGAFDKATWNTLVPGGTTGAPTSVVTPAPAGSGANSTPPGTAPGRTTAVPAAVVRPLDAFKRTTLRPGARGTQVAALQRALGVRATGRMDAPTVAAVKKVQAAWRLRQTGVVDLRTWNRVELTRYPWLGYTGTTLRQGSHGRAVVALQKALRVGADGDFGPATARAVRGVQTRYGLPTTGVVDAITWRAITHAAR